MGRVLGVLNCYFSISLYFTLFLFVMREPEVPPLYFIVAVVEGKRRGVASVEFSKFCMGEREWADRTEQSHVDA